MAQIAILTLFSLLAVGLLVPAAAQAVPSPLDQLRDGTPLDQIRCSGEKVLLQKNEKPYCVSAETALKLLERGGFFAVKQISDDAPSEGAIQKQKDATGPADIPAEPAEPLHDEPANTPYSQPPEDDDPSHMKPGPATREPADIATTTPQPAKNQTSDKELTDQLLPAKNQTSDKELTDQLLPATNPTSTKEQQSDTTTTQQPATNNTSAKDYISTVANGKITIKNFERIQAPDAVWFPMSHEDAIAVMQRLAKGFDDKVIFPLERETAGDYAYATENNGIFQLHKGFKLKTLETLQDDDVPHTISHIEYYTPKLIPFDEHEEFMRSALDKAGFYYIDNIYSHGPGYDHEYYSEVNGNGGGFSIQTSSVYKIYWFNDMNTRIGFYGWSNLDKSTNSIYPSVSEKFEQIDRAREFADKHKHLFDCEYVESDPTYKYSGQSYYVSSGILFSKVDAGNCYDDDDRWRAIVYVSMAPMNDDIMWFSSAASLDIHDYLPDDWTEHIYIPDYAKASSNE